MDGLRVQVAALAVLRVVWRFSPILHALVPKGLDSQGAVMHAVVHTGRGLQALRSLAAHVGRGKAEATPGALRRLRGCTCKGPFACWEHPAPRAANCLSRGARTMSPRGGLGEG